MAAQTASGCGISMKLYSILSAFAAWSWPGANRGQIGRDARTAIRPSAGTISLSIPKTLLEISLSMLANPVMFPPGRDRFLTRRIRGRRRHDGDGAARGRRSPHRQAALG